MGAIGLQEDEARIGIGPGGRQEEVRRHRDLGTGFGRDEPAKAVIHVVDMVQLFRDSRARDIRRATDDALPISLWA
jgi:hypothetical protein